MFTIKDKGDFFVNISTKTDNKGIKETATGLDNLIGKAKTLAAGYLAIKAAKEFINTDRAIIKDAAELGRMSDTLGVATEDLEQFGRAFEIVGADAQEAYNIISKLKQLPASIKQGFGDDMAEAFGRATISLDKLKEEDPLGTFNEIRKVFSGFSEANRLLHGSQLGFSEKTLRVLRQTDEEYQKILAQAKEAPLLNREQKRSAESYTRKETRAGIYKDALLRQGAIATAPTLEKGVDKILDGAKFIDATFSDSKKDERGKRYSEKDTVYSRLFGFNPITKKIFDFVEGLVENNSKVLSGEISARKDKKGLMPEEARNREIERQIPKNWDGQKTVIINNNFQNKTDIQVKEASNLQKDLTRHIPNIVDEVFGTSMKQASENFKSGVLQ
jgi:hypothetical protein